MRLVMEPGWQENVCQATDGLFEEKLGPRIEVSAIRYAPVDTGALVISVEHHLEGHDLVVSATGGAGGRAYALYVEMGHRIVAWGHDTGRFQPPHPFLRPALFQERSD